MGVPLYVQCLRKEARRISSACSYSAERDEIENYAFTFT